MKNRFPNDQRARWRQRFIAIARQADPIARSALGPVSGHPHRPADPFARAEIRVRFAAITSH